jgi:hypothetical protein
MFKHLLMCGAFLCVSGAYLYAQDDQDNTKNINSYNEEGTSFGAPAQEKPVKKKTPSVVKSAPSVKSSEENERGAPASPSGEDDQYIQADDYFISDDAFTSQAWIWVSLSKMVTPPTESSKKEAEFMKVTDGNKVWTKYYYKSVIAMKSDLKLGTVIIGFNDNNRDDIYMPPDSKTSARGGAWFLGKITDLTDLYKGFVTIAGNYKLSPKNLRVLVK